jgi:unsaturated chondroitin disaccharide hydrolase
MKLFAPCLIFLSLSTFAQPYNAFKQDKNLVAIIDKNFEDADKQYHVLMANLPPGKFPKTWHPAQAGLETSNSGWWCSGFYPGTLLNIYMQTGDSSLYKEAMRMLELLKSEQYNKTTHDLGFMIYCSFGTANYLEHKAIYDSIIVNAARSLSTRFNPKVGCIKSWDSKPNEFLVIIDNMMNLELLFKASAISQDYSFDRIAITHANATMKNHFRSDYSSWHVVNYDPETGAVKQKKTAQGAADGSAWSRGQAWGLYGFTVMYRNTKNKEYLGQATHIADFILSHPNLPTDKIPYWDFNAPGIPDALRDASAAAIIASAFLELQYYATPRQGAKYLKAAEAILRSLSSDHYKAAIGTNGGFILKHGVGNMPQKTEVDVPLSYADYYFIEAMRRYKEMRKLY